VRLAAIAVATWTIVWACLGPLDVSRAQDAAVGSADDAPAGKPAPVDCRKRWGCWEFMHATKGTVLGLKTTVSRVGGDIESELDAAVVTSYTTEHYATHEHLALHFSALATLGGGTAGTESSVGFGLDFGWRAPVSPTSGPFLRAGTGYFRFAHRELELSIFEPVQLRAGYQLLDGPRLIEVGVTEGMIPLGHYGAGRDAERDLDRATELGAYAAVHFHPLRFSASLMHLFPEASQARGGLDFMRAAACTYQYRVTICGDLFYVRGAANLADKPNRMTHSFYTGLAIGLSP